MDFRKLLSLASKKQQNVEKSVVTVGKRYDTSVPPPSREVKKKLVGVQSAAVRAFLEKKEKEQKHKEFAEKKKAEKCQEYMQQYVNSKKHAKGANGIQLHTPEKRKPEHIKIPKISQGGMKADGKSESELRVSTKITTKLIHPSARNSHKSAAKEKPSLFTTFKEKGSKDGNHLASTAKESRDSHRKERITDNAKRLIQKREQERQREKTLASKGKTKMVKRAHQSRAKAPMSFQDILKLAQNKDKGVGSVSGAEKDWHKVPEDRPMTQEEKDRLARKQTKEYQEKYSSAASKKGSVPISTDTVKSQISRAREMPSNKVEPKGNGAILKVKTNGASSKPSLSRPGVKTAPPSGGRPVQLPQKKYAETRENVLICRPASSKQKSDSEDEPEQHLSAWDRIYKKMNKNRPVKRKYDDEEIFEDDYEDDYSDDLDNFIDDGPVEGQAGVSKYIREIFGYDKRKFRNERIDDIDNMETNFASQMKEEARSTRLGKQEDLEDMRQEELMAKRKVAMMKNAKKTKR
ncbi:protein SPT2 homolog [Lineus longissimus]|uniref:protein SPT2 homolog n=1 Tax=Lineus longissimus TaxID=88925 RepID=UPI002B4DA53F